MKVFLSWSGQRSKAAAELLKWWTRSIIQAARPWISTEDVDRGSLWFSQISDNLSDTAIGIVCLTQENKDRPWILFEAGALAKGLSNSRVCTFLVDLTPSDIRDPLAQFNHTQPTEDDMLKLARTLNRQLGENALEDTVLTGAFDAYWPQFRTRWAALLEGTPAVTNVEKRPADDIMSEILENVRGMNQRIRALEAGVEQTPTWNTPVVQSKHKATRLAMQAVAFNKIKRMVIQGASVDETLREAEEHGFSREIGRAMLKQALEEVVDDSQPNTSSSEPAVTND